MKKSKKEFMFICYACGEENITESQYFKGICVCPRCMLAALDGAPVITDRVVAWSKQFKAEMGKG